jgi:hypothetical protein
MRVISGFVAAAMLVALSQPAFAVCIYRGTAKTCGDDPKYWAPAQGPEKETSVQAPLITDNEPPSAQGLSSVKSIVMQPSALTDNAWVLLPENRDGATTLVSTMTTAPACEPGTNC